MRHISEREAGENFFACIAEVESGERLVVERGGRPVAEIVPFVTGMPESRRLAAHRRLMELLREGLPMGGVPLTRDEMHER